MTTFNSIQDQVDYHFHDSALLREAFLASGAPISSVDVEGPVKGNKRLALVGDAVLRLAVLDEWFESGTNTAEGHGRVVELGTNKRLAEVAQNWDLKKYVIENPSQQGEFPRELLASTVEAILGAVWLDSYRDFGKVQKVFKKLCS
ncbi:ribonuclease III domain-containing protein [Paraphoma chrysanthemicola]|uniref:Ribonuclease III domain-containing protein n=1 Tax=Paraphoma chrysanthemicola TaxID=798071 RepID=A0A8K0R2N1_9PLEO|nr:ribonuclease III domain-containing protein [Paraphoma chrysanthemicola]